jgi:glycosyltransferase involved in cell wall biosynthesis
MSTAMTLSYGNPRDLTLPHRRPEITVLSPVYMGERSVPELVDRVRVAVERVTKDYEIVLVEDGSPDGSWRSIELACRQDRRVRGIRLSQNFGQTCALTAGLAEARGKCVVVLDCDLQDDPIYIPDLYWAAQKGVDIVYTRKRRRRHRGLRDLLGRLFHMLFNVLMVNKDLRTESVIGNYSLLSRRAVDAFLSFKEYHRNYLTILRRLGFDVAHIDIEHRDRPYGKSSYSFSKLLRLAVDAITSETDRLLYLSIGIGLGLVAIAFAAAVYIVIAYFVHGFRAGWASVFVLILIATGAILTSHGITGVCIGKIFEQTKGRPLYLVRDRLNFPYDALAEAKLASSERAERTSALRRRTMPIK